MTITQVSDVERELRAEIDRLKGWAKLGLRALEYASTGNRRAELIAPAIAAFKQALAGQPSNQLDDINVVDMPAQREPVAVVSGYYGGQCVILPIDPARIFNSNTPLYAPPQPAQRKPLTDEMVIAAARMLSDRQAAACNVDCGDMWKLHGNDFLEDARAALEAAHGIKEQS